MKKRTCFLTACFIALSVIALSVFTPLTASAHESSRVIRVCYYPLETTSSQHEEHIYHNYYYDYLQELSQYTDWSYEYVDADYEDCISMLKNHEIDLICGIDKTEAGSEWLDYSASYVMNAKHKLYTTADNDDFYYDDYEHFDGINVGILNSCGQAAAIDDLCATQHITLHKVFFDSAEEMEKALSEGKIDALYAMSVSDNTKFRIAHHFSPTILYLATWKGNDLMDEVNSAQGQIRTVLPFFEYDLFQNNIGSQQNMLPYFTREEIAYIAEHPTITISADPSWEPIEYTDPVTGELTGFSAEILELLEEYTGLQFVYSGSRDFTEALEKLSAGEVEVLTALSHDYTWAEKNHVNLTTPYLDSYIVMIYNHAKNSGLTTAALPRDFNVTDKILATQDFENILYFDTTEECIDAIVSGKADCTFTNNYVANYHLSNMTYRNLSAVKISGISENLAIAVSKDSDPRLLSILNKGLQCIPTEKIDALILTYTLSQNDLNLRMLLYAYPEVFIAVIIFISLLVVTALLIAFLLHYRKAHVIETASQTDALTGILNRGAVQSQITAALDREKQLPDHVCPLIAVDLDNFKYINDTYGHMEGDLLLKAVAKTLKNAVRQTDIVGRLGGDEFIVYLTNISTKKTAEKVAAMLCAAVSALSLEKEEWSEITGSFGIAFATPDMNWDTLYNHADRALYDAKEKGKNQYCVYSDTTE